MPIENTISTQFAKRWEDLTFTDNFIFSKVMENENICKELLETLLEIKIDKIIYQKTEESIIPDYDAKSVRFDVYVRDSDRIFDIEIQTYDENSIAKRARYYQGICDVDNLLKGARYDKLPESFIIFICTTDPFEYGLPVYDVKKTFNNTEIEYNDYVHTIFFNAACYEKVENPTLRSFLQYVHNKKIENEFTSKIDKATEFAKHNARWRVEYMFFHDILDEEKDIAHSEGIVQGREEGAHDKAIESARNLLALKVITPEQIARANGLPLEEVLELRNSINSELQN